MVIRKKRLPSSKSSSNKDTVGVYLRLRPLKLDEPILVKVGDQQVKTLPPDGSISQVYSFTQVFDNAPQSEIFDKVARPVVEDFITAGKDGLIFTYGITGSGKTYTMEGLKSDPGLIYKTIDFIFNSIGAQQTQKHVIENDGSNSYFVSEQERSIYPNLARTDTMSAIPSVVKWRNRTKETAHVSTDPTAYYCLFISLIELYNKQVHDLLEDFDTNNSEKDKKRREIRTDRGGHSYVANAVELEVKSADEAVELYTRGIKRRKTGSTALNQESSRGHCVLNLRLVQVHKSYDGNFNEDTLVSSQLCLVDLAGSERAKRSGATGGALQEACNINNSLGALRKCIRALRDCEPTANIQYREYNLTRLFKSYFEGHGSVRMVLCVKPTQEDFHENNIAMEFGLLTQDVAIDYASPPKMLKRSKSRVQNTPLHGTMYDLSEKKFTCPDFEDFGQFMKYWRCWLAARRPSREKTIEALLSGKNEFRHNLIAKMSETKSLKEQYENAAKELREREQEIRQLEGNKKDQIHTLKKHVERLEENSHEAKRQNQELHNKNMKLKEIILQQSKEESLLKDVVSLLKSEETRTDILKRVTHLLKKLEPQPSAPELEPLQSSSPVDFPTSEMTDSNTPPTTTNSSSEAMEYQEHAPRSPIKNLLSSPTNGGVPVVNPRHNRSLSCSSMQWIHHRPQGTIDTGTVLKPKFKNGKSVRNLRSSDILRKDAGGYSVVHQDAHSNGDVETSVYKGQIISTVCGGAQVILNDIETMRQVSPEKKRAISDAHYTH